VLATLWSQIHLYQGQHLLYTILLLNRAIYTKQLTKHSVAKIERPYFQFYILVYFEYISLVCLVKNIFYFSGCKYIWQDICYFNWFMIVTDEVAAEFYTIAQKFRYDNVLKDHFISKKKHFII